MLLRDMLTGKVEGMLEKVSKSSVYAFASSGKSMFPFHVAMKKGKGSMVYFDFESSAPKIDGKPFNAIDDIFR